IGDEPLPPRRVQKSVPADLETICLKCLQKAPAKRYVTAAELADDLGHFLRGEPIKARPVGRAERAYRWCRRKPLAAGLLATVALSAATLVAATVFLFRAYHDASNQRDVAVQEGKRADDNFESAQDAVGRLTRAATEHLASVPQGESIQKKL